MFIKSIFKLSHLQIKITTEYLLNSILKYSMGVLVKKKERKKIIRLEQTFCVYLNGFLVWAI